MWHGASKSESENSGGNNGFKNADCKNNYEVEKVGRKNSVILNHVDFNHINTNSNNSNHADSNHANLDQFIQADSTTIHDSADSCALNKILSWYGESTDASSGKFSNRTQLAYVPPMHTSHTPYTVNSFYSYPPEIAPQKSITCGISSYPPSPLHDS